MKKMKIPAVFAGLAAAGFGLRYLVYALAVDGKNLIVSGHPALITLWVLTAAALALAALTAFRQKEEGALETIFSAGGFALLGHGLLGAGMLLTALLNPLPMPGLLGTLWKILGVLGAVCLLAAGFDRLRGKKPFFALYGPASLFFAVHVVAHYQIWCSNPQFTDYAFALLASMALCLTNYQLCAFSADLGSRRQLYLWALAGTVLCGAEMAQSMYPYLYLGGILFSLTALPTQAEQGR